MFIWVAIASVLVGAAIVVNSFLIKKILFTEKVLSQKQDTLTTLTYNNKQVESLKTNVRALGVNQELMDSMNEDETNAVQVVLDALPSKANSSAFGSSMQQKILKSDYVDITMLNVDPVIGVESQDTTGLTTMLASTSSVAPAQPISFRFTISVANDKINELKDALTRVEKSIRPINITSITVTMQGSTAMLSGVGETYYLPAKSVAPVKCTVGPKTKVPIKVIDGCAALSTTEASTTTNTKSGVK